MIKLTKQRKLYGMLGIVLLIFVGWALFFHFYPVERLVNDIGIENTYLAAFLLAVIGGFSSVTGTSLYAALVALAHGGVNPTVLGIVGGLGLFISDSIFYFVASRMRKLIAGITDRWERLFRRMWSFVYRMPKWVVYGAIFLYSAVAPIPNDILLAVLALSSYSYRQFALALLLGDLTMTLLLTHLGGSIGL
jgi:hypothetical protein